jgi:hypothetical protein
VDEALGQVVSGLQRWRHESVVAARYGFDATADLIDYAIMSVFVFMLWTRLMLRTDKWRGLQTLVNLMDQRVVQAEEQETTGSLPLD